MASLQEQAEKEFGGIAPIITTPRGMSDEQKRAFAAKEFEGIPVSEGRRFATAGERLEVTGKRAVGSLLQSGGVAAGAAKGFQVGAKRGLIPGLVVGALGAALGAVGGDGLARVAESQDLAIANTDDIPSKLKPYGRVGEVLGGSIPFLAAPGLAFRAGVKFPSTWAGNILNGIVESAGRSPGRFVARELKAVTASAIASGGIEAVSPESPVLRFTGEVIAGGVSALNLPSRIGKMAGTRVTSFVKDMMPQGRKTRAGEIVVTAFEEAGGDTDALINILSEVDPKEVEGLLTAAQKTGSEEIAAMTAELTAADPKFAAEILRKNRKALLATTNAIALMRGTGDPMAVKAAADLRADTFNMIIRERVDEALRKTQRAAEAITRDTPKARAGLSQTGSEIMGEVLTRVRTVESTLWGKVNVAAKIKPEGLDTFFERLSTIRGQRLEAEPLPAFLEETIVQLRESRAVMIKARQGTDVSAEVLAKAQERFSVGNLIRVRSRLLTLARDASRKEPDNARVFGELAESILDDLDKLGDAVPGSALEEARIFSRQLNDVFTRTFVGKVAGPRAKGIGRLPPEVTLTRAFASGKEMGDLQMRQMEEATRFLSDRGLGSEIDQFSIDAMLDAQERILRLAAAQFVKRNPATQQVASVDTNGLRNFILNNENLLDRFPQAKALMEDAIQTEAGREALKAQVTRVTETAKNKGIISDAFDVESIASAVRGALRGTEKPVAALERMMTLAQRSGPEAVDGLRAGIWEDAFASATNPGGTTSVPNLISAITDPIKPGLPSMLQVMRRGNLVNDTEMATINQVVERMRRIQTATETTGGVSLPLREEDMIADLLLRVKGSQAAGAIFGRGGGAGNLIIPQAGSAFARKVFQRLPSLKVSLVLQAAMRGDPVKPGGPRYGLLLELMKTGRSQREKEIAARQIHAWLIQSGVGITQAYAIEGENE